MEEMFWVVTIKTNKDGRPCEDGEAVYGVKTLWFPDNQEMEARCAAIAHDAAPPRRSPKRYDKLGNLQ